MKILILLLFPFALVAQETPLGLRTVIVGSDTILYAYNPLTRDSVQLTRLPRTIAQAYSAGTPYTLTATPALVDMGTTDPSITLPKSGTYLVLVNFRFDYSGSVIAAGRTVTYKVRRINNTPADIFTPTGFLTQQAAGALTFSGPDNTRFFYYTGTAGDTLQLWASITGGVISVGSVTVPEANIIALRLY